MRRGWAPLVLVLLLAGSLRLAGIRNASFFHYDEGQIAKSALGPAVAFRWAVRSAWEGEPLTRESLRAAYDSAGIPYASFSARPGFQSLATFSMALFGVSDLAMILLSSASGLATVWLLYALLARLSPEGNLPLWGALALAVSPDHVFYSRTGFAHVTAAFFLVWAASLYLTALAEGRRVPAFRTGLAAGYAFTCHFNVAWAAAAFFAFDAWRSRWEGTEGKAGRWVRRAAAAAWGFSVPILFFQGVSLLLVAVAGDRFSELKTYFGELAGQREHLFRYCNPRAESAIAFYGIHWLRTEGPGLTAGALAGMLLCVRSRRAAEVQTQAGILAACLVAVPLLLASGMTWKVARTVVPLIPFGSILWGVCIARWTLAARWILLRRLFVAASIVPAFWQSMGYLDGHGHYRELVGALQKEGRRVFAIDEDPAVDFYVARRQATFVRDWKTYEEIRSREGGQPGTLIALWKDGHYGFSDPVYANRYGFLREVVDRTPGPARVLPFRVPLEYEFVDPSFRWDRLLRLTGVRYEVHLFDLE